MDNTSQRIKAPLEVPGDTNKLFLNVQVFQKSLSLFKMLKFPIYFLCQAYHMDLHIWERSDVDNSFQRF